MVATIVGSSHGPATCTDGQLNQPIVNVAVLMCVAAEVVVVTYIIAANFEPFHTIASRLVLGDIPRCGNR